MVRRFGRRPRIKCKHCGEIVVVGREKHVIEKHPDKYSTHESPDTHNRFFWIRDHFVPIAPLSRQQHRKNRKRLSIGMTGKPKLYFNDKTRQFEPE